MIVCNICGECFTNKKIYANHIRWKHKTDRSSTEYKIFVDKVKVGLTQERILKSCSCEKCGKTFELSLTQSQWDKKEHLYCSRSCANSRVQTNEMNEARKSKLTVVKKCPICGQDFNGKRKFCSDDCLLLFKRRNLDGRQLYKKMCEFKFSLKDYPDEFDFELLRSLGMYAPENAKHPNPNGLARDHRVSIEYGWQHNVDPKIISHPANCKLITQKENEQKYTKCEITLEQLLEDIKAWDMKYGAVAEKVMQ